MHAVFFAHSPLGSPELEQYGYARRYQDFLSYTNDIPELGPRESTRSIGAWSLPLPEKSYALSRLVLIAADYKVRFEVQYFEGEPKVFAGNG